MVLASFEAEAKSADLLNETAPIDAQMAEHVLRQHERRVPIGLEIGIIAAPLDVDLILIGEDQINVWMGVDLFSDPVERVFRNKIIGIHESDEVAGGHRQRAV